MLRVLIDMQLRKIYIDGFGIFSTQDIPGFKDGLNVVFGPNERGKTTLRTFIERVLFGFPTKAAKRQYPALAGGGYGGRLEFVFADGREVAISRKQGPKKSQLTISMDSGQLVGDDQLKPLIGNISQSFYHTVYAFDLEEFIALGALESADLKERVYGAAEGLNAISINTVKTALRGQAEDIYKSRGPSLPLNRLLASIRESENAIASMKADLSEFDGMINTHNLMLLEIDQLKISQKKFKDSIRDLEYKKTQFPAYVELANAKSKLEALPDVPVISAASNQEFIDLIGEIKNVDTDILKETKEKERLVLERGQLAYNQGLIEKEPTVNLLLEQSAVYANALEDKKAVSLQSNELKADIDIGTSGLGSGWTMEKVRGFQFSQAQKDMLQQFSDRFKRSAESILSGDAKLLSARDRMAGAKPRNASAWGQVRTPIFIMTALSLAGLAAGLIFNQTWLAVFSSLMLGVLALLMLILRKTPLPAVLDAQEQLYLSEIEQITSRHSKLEQEWHEFLGSCDFDMTLSCDGARNVLDAISKIQSDLKQHDGYVTRLQNMESVILKVEADYMDVCQSVPSADLSGSVSADIKMLGKYLSTSKLAMENASSLVKSIERRSKEITVLQGTKGTANEKLSAILTSFGCADEKSFRTNYEFACRKDELNNTITSLTGQIQAVSGTGELFDRFIASLSQTDLSSIESSLDKARELQDQTEESITVKNGLAVELKLKTDRLASEVDIFAQQEQVEADKQRLRDLAMDWARSQLAVTLIDKAVLKYEKTGQPEVLKAATNFFSIFTGGAYVNIYKPAHEEGLRVMDAARTVKTIDDLSTGTVQQLYLAIRFGLIQNFERQSEPMPIIMDDLLVNFDDVRTQATMQQIVDFAQARQVIYLTCHGATRDAFAKLGIESIAI